MRCCRKSTALNDSQMEDCGRHVMLGGTRGGPVLVRGKGVRVWDAAGRDYIDCTSQSWALYLGCANDAVNQVICEHIESLTHVHQGFDSKPRFYLARKLAQLAPGALNRVSFHRRRRAGHRGGDEGLRQECRNGPGFRLPARQLPRHHPGHDGRQLISTHANGQYMGGSRSLLADAPVHPRIPNPYTYRNPFNVIRKTYKRHVPDDGARDFRTRHRRAAGRRDCRADSGQCGPDYRAPALPGRFAQIVR